MKTKLPLSVLLIALTTLCFAGASEKQEVDRSFKRVYFGISVTPNVAFRYLKPNPSSSTPASFLQNTIDARNHIDIPGPGVAAGLKVGVRLTHFLAIESGALITLDQYHSKSSLMVWPTAPTDTFKRTIDYTYLYFNIPLALNFTIGHRKVRGIVSLGTTFDFILQQKTHTSDTHIAGNTDVSQTTVNTHNFNTFNLSPFLGLGIDCYCSKAVVLRIMPQAQMQGLKNSNAPVTEYLFNAGLNVSLLFGVINKN